MNKKERALRAIRGEAVDRPPVCFWHHFGDLGPQGTVDAHIRFFEQSGMDILKMMCDEFFVYPLNGAKSAQDFLNLRPLGADSPYIRGQVERATKINEALRGSAVTLYNAFSPYATLKHAMGDAQSMALLREHETAALHALDVIAQDTCTLVEEILKKTGTQGMMIPLQGAEEGRFTQEEYGRLVAPSERRVIECAQAHSDSNLLHFCGWDGIPNHLEWWTSYPGRMVNWAVFVEKIDLRQGRERFPGRVLMGGFDNRPGTLLTSGPREAIEIYTRRLVREAGARSLILGADCSLPEDIDPQRIRWVIEALEK